MWHSSRSAIATIVAVAQASSATDAALGPAPTKEDEAYQHDTFEVTSASSRWHLHERSSSLMFSKHLQTFNFCAGSAGAAIAQPEDASKTKQ